MADTDPEMPRIELSPRRVRAFLSGHAVADSTAARYVWEHPYYPQYYLPLGDVIDGALVPTDEPTVFDVRIGDRRADGAARRFDGSPSSELHDLVRFDFAAMDAWFEEDEEIFVHPRDPYKRIDVLASSRHVRVSIDGEIVGDSHRPHLLFETGLLTRYYLPKVDVRMDLLSSTDTVTHCPYKGAAEYWSVTVGDATHDDVVWGYRAPVHESAAVAGLVCFYNEQVDISIDGVAQERPSSPFV